MRQITLCLFRVVFLLAVLTGSLNADGSKVMPDSQDEIYHYQEITGDFSKDITWQLRKSDDFILSYSSPDEHYVTTTDLNYNTLSWKVIDETKSTDFIAERVGKTIKITGVFNGLPVKKSLEIDNRDWYQATSFSLRHLILSKESETTFWTIRFNTLTAHKIKAVKKEITANNDDGNKKKLLRIRLGLTGLMTPFWKSDYWFSMPESVFFKFKGPSGPPGYPLTTVIRVK